MRNGRSSGPPGWLFNTSPRRLIVQPLLLGLIALLPILEGWHGQPRWAAIVLTVALAGGVIWIGLTVVALWRRPE